MWPKGPLLRSLAAGLLLFISVPTAFTSASVDSDLFTYWSSVPPGRDQAGGKVASWAGESEIFGETYSISPTPYGDFVSLLPPCNGSQFLDCIEAIMVRKVGSSSWKRGTVAVRELQTEIGRTAIDYGDGKYGLIGFHDADISRGLPAGRTASIWSIPSAPHAGGTRYLVSAAYASSLPGFREPPIKRFNLVLRPFDATSNADPFWVNPIPNGYRFPEGYEYRVDLRLETLKESIPRFFYGRIHTPQIDLEGNRMSIVGEPENYPVARSGWLDYEALPESVKKTISRSVEPNSGTWGSWAGAFLGLNDEYDFSRFNVWEKYLSQIGQNNAWSMQSFNRDYLSCDTKGIAGFASANSLLFSTEPPRWNANDQSISYRMASLSKDESGRPNRGNFDLAMSKDLVRCLWEFMPKNSSEASVSLIYQDGKPKIATSSLKIENDWLYLKVTGFTFSNPTLKVRFEQGSTKKKLTIICTKGNVSRKITGSNPKCPPSLSKRS